MSRKKLGNPVEFSIDSNKPNDREDLLLELCKTLSVDPVKEIEELGIVPNASNVIMVNIDHLFKFFYKYKLKGEFNFTEKTLTVISDQYHNIGNTMIKEPDTIKSNEADVIPPLPNKKGNGPMTPLPDDLMSDEDEDDDLPF